MKTSLLATLFATVLTATNALAAPIASQAGPYPPSERGRDFRDGNDRGYRPDFQQRNRWNDGRRYGPAQYNGYGQQPGYGYSQPARYGDNQGPAYGYGQAQPVILQTQPRRPVGVSINVQL